jgi:hypothetical protein
MFQRMIDDVKDSAGRAAQLTSLAGIIALAIFIALSFLCAAAFVFVLQTYGLIEACLAGAGVFFVVALIAAVGFAIRKRRVKARARETAKSAMQTALADPMIMAAGIQVVRAIGIKKLIPILAVGGLALGLLASRGHATDQTPAE